jgi:hypothetical protein
MTIEAIDANIKWLQDRLYVARRILMADGVEHPVFVLLTKTPEERAKIENLFLNYYRSMYGDIQFVKSIRPGSNCAGITHLELPELCASIALIDI